MYIESYDDNVCSVLKNLKENVIHRHLKWRDGGMVVSGGSLADNLRFMLSLLILLVIFSYGSLTVTFKMKSISKLSWWIHLYATDSILFALLSTPLLIHSHLFNFVVKAIINELWMKSIRFLDIICSSRKRQEQGCQSMCGDSKFGEDVQDKSSLVF